MGRKTFCDSGETTITRVPQNKCDGLQNFLRDKLPARANIGCCVEDIWKNFKDIAFEVIERFVPHKILKLNPDPEYNNKEVKQLKVKVRRAYNKRK